MHKSHREFLFLTATVVCVFCGTSNAALPGEYQGWGWVTAINKSSPSNLKEEYCFGQVDMSIAGDLTWDFDGTDEVCWGRTTTNVGRTLNNFDPGTMTFIGSDNYTLQSTQPLLSAGGNLREVLGEEVIMGSGDGEERFGTMMSTPSDDSLIILAPYFVSDDGGVEENETNVIPLVKSTPAVRDARVTDDLAGTDWRTSFYLRSMSRNGVGNVEFVFASINSISLLAAGVCDFTLSSVFPGSPNDRNRYFAVQFDNNDTLGNRGVQAGLSENFVTDCTYEIDADKYLSLNFTSSSADPEDPNPTAINFRYVVSDDERFLVHAPSTTGIDDDPTSMFVAYRAASGVAASLIDGTYFLNLLNTEYSATGTQSSTGNVGSQEFESMDRARFVFDAAVPGTPPPGEAGSWSGCVAEFIGNEYDLQYAGSFGANDVTAITEPFPADTALTTCDYRLDADGSLAVYLTFVDPEAPDEPFEGLFRGYVNDNGELMTLILGTADPDLVEDPETEEFGGILMFVGMEYSGDPFANADADRLNNLEEFQYPLPPRTLATSIVALPNIGGSASPDIGVAVPGSTRVHIRDGNTDALISDIDFGTDPAFDMAVIPNLGAGSDPEIAVLGERPSGQIRVQMKDSVTGASVSNAFYGDQYSGIRMAVVDNFSDGPGPELAVLGQQDGTDRIRVMIRDAANDTGIKSLFLGNRMVPEHIVAVSDVTGGGIQEIVTTGTVMATNQIMSPVRDASTAALHQTLFWANQYAPVKTLTIADINGGGAPEIVSLGMDPATRAVRLQIRDVTSRTPITTEFLGNTSTPIDMVIITDTNANGFPDVAVLTKTATEAGLVRVYDTFSGDLLKNVFFNALLGPAGLAALSDYSAGGLGFDELAVLGFNGGVRQVQIKDSKDGTLVNSIDFP